MGRRDPGHALQQRVVSLTIEVQNVPYVKAGERLVFSERAPDYWQGVARYGFMEQPHIPQLLQSVSGPPAPFVPEEITWYLGHEPHCGKFGFVSVRKVGERFVVTRPVE